MKKKIVGYNYLHDHPLKEQSLGVDNEHVIVDRIDYEEIIKYFIDNPNEVEKLGKKRFL